MERSIEIKNKVTGDMVEITAPNSEGKGIITVNGQELYKVQYSADGVPCKITLDSGKEFYSAKDFSDYVVAMAGGWENAKCQE